MIEPGWRQRSENARAKQEQKERLKNDPEHQAKRAERARILQDMEDRRDADSAAHRAEAEKPTLRTLRTLAELCGDQWPDLARDLRKLDPTDLAAALDREIAATAEQQRDQRHADQRQGAAETAIAHRERSVADRDARVTAAVDRRMSLRAGTEGSREEAA